MPVDKPGVWLITVAILLIGAFLFFSLGRPDRERREAIDGVPLGSPAESVTAAIGSQPAVCPGSPLGHLAVSFPDGWAQAAIDVALESLEANTAERWVYSMDPDVTPTCADTGERTEIGVTADGTILWSVSVFGSSPVELPPTLTPSGTAEAN